MLPGSYAWGENIGWLNALPLGPGGPGLDVGPTGITGFMWGENVGWVSFSCTNDSSCGSASYGVTRAPDGALSGYAWAENAGWISFSCANTGTCGAAPYGVVVSPLDGAFSGFAWGENIGWISFSCRDTASCEGSGAVPFGVATPLAAPIIAVPALGAGSLTLLALLLCAAALFTLRRLG